MIGFSASKIFAVLGSAKVLLASERLNIVRAGIRGYPSDFMTNNVATQGLEELLSQG